MIALHTIANLSGIDRDEPGISDTECRAGHGSISQDCRPSYEIAWPEGEDPLRAAMPDLHDQIDLSFEEDIDVGIDLAFAEEKLSGLEIDDLSRIDQFVDLVAR